MHPRHLRLLAAALAAGCAGDADGTFPLDALADVRPTDAVVTSDADAPDDAIRIIWRFPGVDPQDPPRSSFVLLVAFDGPQQLPVFATVEDLDGVAGLLVDHACAPGARGELVIQLRDSPPDDVAIAFSAPTQRLTASCGDVVTLTVPLDEEVREGVVDVAAALFTGGLVPTLATELIGPGGDTTALEVVPGEEEPAPGLHRVHLTGPCEIGAPAAVRLDITGLTDATGAAVPFVAPPTLAVEASCSPTTQAFQIVTLASVAVATRPEGTPDDEVVTFARRCRPQIACTDGGETRLTLTCSALEGRDIPLAPTSHDAIALTCADLDGDVSTSSLPPFPSPDAAPPTGLLTAQAALESGGGRQSWTYTLAADPEAVRFCTVVARATAMTFGTVDPGPTFLVPAFEWRTTLHPGECAPATLGDPARVQVVYRGAEVFDWLVQE